MTIYTKFSFVVLLKIMKVKLMTLIVLQSCFNSKRQNDGSWGGESAWNQISEYPVMKVVKGNYQGYKTYSTNIKGIGFIEVRSKVAGYIEKIFVDEGQMVKKGQLLFQLETDVLSKDAEAARSNVKSANASVKSAELEVQKLTPLVKQKIISQVQLTTAQEKLNVAQAQLAQARSKYESVRANIKYTKIVGPVDGIVGELNFRKVSLVGSSSADALTSIADNHVVQAYILRESFFKIKTVKLSFLAKSNTINYILRYYVTNIVVWMISYFILGSLQFHKPDLSSEFIKMNISYSIWSGIFHGIIWGSVFYITILLRDKLTSYYSILFFSALANLISTSLMVYCNFYVDELVNFEDMPQTISQIYQFYKSQMFYVLVLHTFLTALIVQFVYEMDRKLGQSVLLKFLLGRYHKPTEEKRVFSFMDLKSSTYYAEQLGHFKYSRLIQDCFNDLSTSALKNKAQIYQFVGDEVVLTWEINRNFNAKHCMQCFVDFTNKLASKKEYYMNQYGMLPEFKAGLHAGKVMVAQVGQLKSEIAYHGDAINTASRIQALCNHYQSFLLFSNDFLTLLTEKQVHTIKYQSLGPVAIKGKNKLVDLYRFSDRMKPAYI